MSQHVRGHAWGILPKGGGGNIYQGVFLSHSLVVLSITGGGSIVLCDVFVTPVTSWFELPVGKFYDSFIRFDDKLVRGSDFNRHDLSFESHIWQI